MIIDFRTSAAPTTYETDICVIGSGAAGLTLAHHLAGRLRVLVIEAGGAARTRGVDDALAGEATDFAFTGFRDGRMRAFGGATRLWAGQLLRLDPIDFSTRDWVPHSGWPFPAATLDPFYARAEQFLGVGTPDYDARIWERFSMRDPGFSTDGEMAPHFTIYMKQPDFTRAFGRALVTGRSVDLLLHAAAVRIGLAADGTHVEQVDIRTAQGRTGHVRARAFVLCGGGIENPRLLLASNDRMAAGIGNARDLVGRFFQDHPSGTAGVLTTTHARTIQDQFRKLRRARILAWPKLALTEAAQRHGRFLNGNCLMLYDYAAGSAVTRAKDALEAVRARHPGRVLGAGLRVLPHLPELAARVAHAAATGKAPAFAPSRVMLKVHVEQVPDPECRVTLSSDRDRFGVPRPRLTWRMHAEELRTMRGITEATGRAFARLGLGTMTVEPWVDGGVDAARGQIEDTYHHAGTTRMAAAPDAGVVDPACRVFGTKNLYVAGGSVFPTSGYANPTLTIVALAIRLSETLLWQSGPAVESSRIR